MGQFARAQRRKAKHAYGLKNDEQANAVLKVLENESNIKAERLKAIKLLEIARPKMEEEMRAEISTEFLMLFAGFLRMKWGYGATRLERSVQEFMDFTEDMHGEKTTVPMIIELLKDETGYDIEEHAAKMAKEAEA